MRYVTGKEENQTGITSAVLESMNPREHEAMLLLVFAMHDLLPWRDEDRGMTLREIREAMAALGHSLTDRQVRFALKQGAEALWMDVDEFRGPKQFWKRLSPERLCGRLRKELHAAPDWVSNIEVK